MDPAFLVERGGGAGLGVTWPSWCTPSDASTVVFFPHLLWAKQRQDSNCTSVTGVFVAGVHVSQVSGYHSVREGFLPDPPGHSRLDKVEVVKAAMVLLRVTWEQDLLRRMPSFMATTVDSFFPQRNYLPQLFTFCMPINPYEFIIKCKLCWECFLRVLSSLISQENQRKFAVLSTYTHTGWESL